VHRQGRNVDPGRDDRAAVLFRRTIVGGLRGGASISLRAPICWTTRSTQAPHSLPVSRNILRDANFEPVTGCIGQHVAGYAYGASMAADTWWWSSLEGVEDPDVSRETGSRTFWLRELLVRRGDQGRGYVHRLHQRPELLLPVAELIGVTLRRHRQRPHRSLRRRPPEPRSGDHRPDRTGRPGPLRPTPVTPDYFGSVMTLLDGSDNPVTAANLPAVRACARSKRASLSRRATPNRRRSTTRWRSAGGDEVPGVPPTL
jgi:hypothetical protein